METISWVEKHIYRFYGRILETFKLSFMTNYDNTSTVHCLWVCTLHTDASVVVHSKQFSMRHKYIPGFDILIYLLCAIQELVLFDKYIR